MSPLGFILLLGLTTPQNQVFAIQRTDLPPTQTVQISPSDDQIKQSQRSVMEQRRLWEQAISDAKHSGRQNADCYAIRSYLFQREDGNAPVLIGTTTCTPANANRTEKVGHPPKAELVPM